MEAKLRLVLVQDASQEFLLRFCMIFGRDGLVRLVEFRYESFDVPRNRPCVISQSLD